MTNSIYFKQRILILQKKSNTFYFKRKINSHIFPLNFTINLKKDILIVSIYKFISLHNIC